MLPQKKVQHNAVGEEVSKFQNAMLPRWDYGACSQRAHHKSSDILSIFRSFLNQATGATGVVNELILRSSTFHASESSFRGCDEFFS